jgi:hypothetical protein
MVSDVIPGTFTATAQVDNVAVPGSPGASTTYTITINGVSSSFTSSSSTQAQVVAGLVAAVNAQSGLGVTASNHASANTSVDLTANTAGVPFTTSVSSGLTLTHTTANIGTGTVYNFTLNGILVQYTCVYTDTAASIRDGLISALRGMQLFEGVVAANPSGLYVSLTSEVPGTAFTLVAGTNTTTAAVTANTSPVFIPFGSAIVKRTGAGSYDRSGSLPSATGQNFVGIAERIHTLVDPMQSYPNSTSIAPGEDMSVGYQGRWYVTVEVAVSAEDPAYFRTTANGSLTQLGAWRNNSDSGNADAVPNGSARFKTSAAAGGIAELQINIP